MRTLTRRLRGRILVERDERAVDEAVAPDLRVDGVRVDELVVPAAGRDAAALEHHDLVGQRDRREAVRDDDRRAALHHGCSASRMRASVVASTEAVASSRIRTRGSTSSARAIESRWRWPPESVSPRSPTSVS